ncbi:hypothetical protein P4O66_001993 [Electrophorus voltai]|uniref:BZIP domain-containing protein n=1 Tax=Electrophorus voltai TaxID=2609070 RepID=A0AAD9E8G4_9TELE|nr:hypothetical protein P4O66_001993 [Electrophorus voltai]
MCSPSSLAEDEEDETMGTRDLMPVTAPSSLAGRLRLLQAYRRSAVPSRRRKREMTPAEKKDALYWDKRRKNNEAAKRSREKRRLNDLMLEGQLLALSEENTQLRAEVLSLSQYYMGVGRSAASRLGSDAPLHSPTPGHLQPSLWGLNAGLPPVDCCQDWPQHWPQLGPCSSSPSTTSPQLFSYLRSSRGYDPTLPYALNSDQLEEASRQVDSAAQQQVSSSDDPDGKQESALAPSACPALSSPMEDFGTPSGQNWLLTGISQPGSQRSKLQVQWAAPCVRPSPLRPCWPTPLPLTLRDTGGPNHGISSIWNFSSKFRMLSAEISQMRSIYTDPNMKAM